MSTDFLKWICLILNECTTLQFVKFDKSFSASLILIFLKPEVKLSCWILNVIILCPYFSLETCLYYISWNTDSCVFASLVVVALYTRTSRLLERLLIRQFVLNERNSVRSPVRNCGRVPLNYLSAFSYRVFRFISFSLVRLLLCRYYFNG